MSAKLSKWLLEDINQENIVNNEDNSISLLATDDQQYANYRAYGNTYARYGNYSNYNDYSRYSRYSNYYNYSNYSNYYNYSNYSNTISISGQPTSQSIVYGSSVTFTLTLSQTPTSYQWYVSSVSSGGGTAINGATSSSYSFTPKISDNGKYYYCIAKLGNTVTSNSALLTVQYLDSCDCSTYINGTIQIYKFVSPSTATITSYELNDSSLGEIKDGNFKGIKEGSTTLKLHSSNNLNKTINITVFNNRLESMLYNIAQAIKKYNNISKKLYPNQFYNALKENKIVSKSYNTLDELLLDLSVIIKNNSTNSLKPEEFSNKILENITHE